MDSDARQKWTDALRSGDYPQTSGVLNRVNVDNGTVTANKRTVGFCCLGVLSELAAREGVIERDETETMLGDTVIAYDGEENELPPAVREWAGLKGIGLLGSYDLDGNAAEQDENGDEMFEGYTLTGTLAEDNDNGMPFEVIARLIERKF